jgi:hypothetical protein
MDRLVPLDGAYKVEVAGTLTGSRTYRKQRDGTIHVESQADRRALVREGLAVPASATGPVAHIPGYRCSCGRRNYFRSCGRCGAQDGTREDMAHAT